ncbi:hypothetical protein DAPPUDRAFT_238460 [Daphnia pulex]|uniref:Uncharacterized protein n=1 Tax=Daphnia pulex TaxID=6669 RepID=E9G6G6_DAPPU|nr:hypothetical protein DAPPUDRAFT_238460 [Daphnia pulex]|eukprot:EFX84932.1 hypothetical protein DAPPUDRAFT_238460 [Daphnia pulex]
MLSDRLIPFLNNPMTYKSKNILNFFAPVVFLSSGPLLQLRSSSSAPVLFLNFGSLPFSLVIFLSSGPLPQLRSSSSASVVKSTTRWPRIVLSHVETTQTALENTQTHTDYQDYNMVSEVLE